MNRLIIIALFVASQSFGYSTLDRLNNEKTRLVNLLNATQSKLDYNQSRLSSLQDIRTPQYQTVIDVPGRFQRDYRGISSYWVPDVTHQQRIDDFVTVNPLRAGYQSTVAECNSMIPVIKSQINAIEIQIQNEIVQNKHEQTAQQIITQVVRVATAEPIKIETKNPESWMATHWWKVLGSAAILMFLWRLSR